MRHRRDIETLLEGQDREAFLARLRLAIALELPNTHFVRPRLLRAERSSLGTPKCRKKLRA
ncbi:MAG: hypothetical protein QGI45_08640 [Myxococcota bacterium]|nr:hypothetical protein [Myxococcota bacterium]